MRKSLSFVIVIMAAAAVQAQNDSGRKRTPENQPVAFKMDAAAKPNAVNPKPEQKVRKERVLRVGPRTTYLKEGLTSRDVIGLLGQPSAVTERSDERSVVRSYEFPRGEGRFVIAEFVNDSLVRSWTETRGPVAHVN